MLNPFSWFTRNRQRPLALRVVTRVCAVIFGAWMASDLSAQTIQLTSQAYSVNEDAGSIRIPVRRFGNANTTSTVVVQASAATAQDGQDFVARTATLTFKTNVTEMFFDVVILDNDATNDNKFINLTLSNPTGGATGNPRTAQIEILDDETGLAGFATGRLEFSAATYTVTDYEGLPRNENSPSYAGANITIVRKGGNRGRILVDFSTGSGTAYPNELYRPFTNQTLVFNDYQMSTNIIVPIIQYVNFNRDLSYNLCWATNDTPNLMNICGAFPFPIPPDVHIWTHFFTTQAIIGECLYYFFYGRTANYLGSAMSPTWDVPLILSNPRLDPEEDQTLSAPTLGAVNIAGLGIVHTDAIRTPNQGIEYTGLGYSWERGHFRTVEGGGGSPTGRGISFYNMFVNRDPCPDTALVRYSVNNDSSPAIGGDHLLRTFRAEAGSEYAHPWVDFLPPGTIEYVIARGGNDQSPVDDGIVTWSLNEQVPKPAIIPIISDDRVEFDEDMLVQLFHRPGDPGLIAPPAQPPYGTVARNANLTIVFDARRFVNEDIFHVSYDTNGVFGAEQPAGAADRRYNRHNENDIDPPFNPTPGANASVLAVAVQPDGKLILGGEFEAINGKKTPNVFHFGRMTRDGQVDTNFNIGNGPNSPVYAIDLQPDGKSVIGGLFSSYNGTLRGGLARVNANGTLDPSFNPGLGVNAPVRALKVLSDGKILIGGEFTTVNGTNINFLARLHANGSLDTSFNAGGSGPDDFVYSLAVSSEPIFAELRSLDVDQRRERSDVYDAGSNTGSVILDYNNGPDPDTIRVYYNGQLIADSGAVAGSGTLSFSFGPGLLNTTLLNVVINEGNPGLHGTVASWSYQLTILPQVEPTILIGGRFTKYNDVRRNRVARLLADGPLDTAFDPGTGIENGIVFAAAKRGKKAVFGGIFSELNRVSRNNIVQLNADGSVDTFFDPGAGFNDLVNTILIHPTGKTVVGGLFTEFNSSRRVSLARLNHDGKLDSSFMDTAYNQFAGLPNPFTWMPENAINAMVNLRLTNTYTAILTITNADNTVTNVDRVFTRIEDQLFVGGSFAQIGGGTTRNAMIPRKNFARIWGGSTPGPGTVGFSLEGYSGDEDSGRVFIIAGRENGHLGAVSSTLSTSDLPQGPGAATDTLDYLFSTTVVPWPSARNVDNFSRQVSEAYRGPNSSEYMVTHEHPGHGLPGTNDVAPELVFPYYVNIRDDAAQEGDEQMQLNFTVAPTFVLLGGEPIPMWPALGRSKARLSIIDNDFNPGVIGFAQAQYFVDENGKKARITLTRTNGSAGRVTVDARTRTPGTTATAGVDFTAINILTIVFAAGQTNAAFDIDIIDDTAAELDENISVALANATGGASIGRGESILTIIDNDFAPGRLSFTTTTNSFDEGAGVATIVVRRSGGSQGTEEVQVSTSDVTARAGIDYVGVTNLVLRWASGNTTTRTITVPILDAGDIDGTRRFRLTLSSPIVNGNPDPNALGNVKDTLVDIIDNDAYGIVRFSQAAYVVDENGTNATITIIRLNGVAGDISVGYSATPQLAIPGDDFTPVSGTLLFTNGQTAASFIIPVLDDAVVDGSKTVVLAVTGQTNNPSGAPEAVPLGFQTQSILTIIDNELENIPAGSLDVTFLAEGANDFIYTVAQQPDERWLIGGNFTAVNSVVRNRLARLESNGTLDPTFFAGDGPNNSVRTLAVQEDGRILIAGAFTAIGTSTRNYIARLVRDGGLDLTFDPGAGANNPIYAMALQSDGKALIGGDFSSYGPTARNGVARLATNGVIDLTFNPGTGGAGAPNFTVYALAIQLDGKILVGGDFTTFNSLPANRLVRLNTDGSVDSTFNTGVGATASVRSIVVQPDGKILVGGLFTSIQGVPANRIARLNLDGSVDTTFNAATIVDAAKRSANGSVSAIAVQIDGKIVLGGDFTEYNGVTRRGLTRLNRDGSNDPTINFGLGANGSVAAVQVQTDRKIVIAGGFTEYNGESRLGLARINGGSIKGSGRLEFSSPSFTVSETSTNGVINVHRIGGTASAITVHYETKVDPSVPIDSRAIAGVDYLDVQGELTFPEGETQASFKVPVLNDSTVEGEKVLAVLLSNPVGQPGADQPGLANQPESRVVITSDDSEISFQAPAYSVGESIPSAAASITIIRTGAISVPVSVDFYTQNGTATSGSDYTGLTNRITFEIGESQRTLAVTITPDSLVEGNETVNLILANPSTGGVFKTGGDRSTLTIADDDFAPGEIRFERPTYSIREGNVIAEVTVIRTNGLTGVVTVEYATAPGAATPDQDYRDVTGILTFADGVSVQVIKVPIFDDDFVENNDTINLTLANVRGGASLGLSTAILTIIDDDLGAGSLDTAFNPGVGANGAIRAIEMDPSRRLLIGGDFTAYNADTNRSHIARLQLSGAADATFKTNNRPNNGVTSLALQADGRIVLGGAFNMVEGQQERRVARLLADGPLDTNFFLPLGLNGQVSSVAIQTDGKVVIGGVFSESSAASRNRIARLNANGQVDVSFDPGSGANDVVNAVTLQSDGKILVGGAFSSMNQIGAGRIARLNSNGSVDTGFRTGTGFSRADGRASIVHDILILASGQIMVVGDFTAYNGSPRAGIAVLDQTGALQSFASGLASVNGAIRAVAIQHTDIASDEKVIIGGDFTFVDGTARPRLARLDATGNFDPAFDPGDGANDSVLGIIVQPWDGRVIVVGAFTEFNNNTNLRGIARVNNDKKFLPTGGADVTLGAVGVLGAELTISFNGEAGVNYMIEATSDFTLWTDVKAVVGTGAVSTTTVPVSGTEKFYRIRRL